MTVPVWNRDSLRRLVQREIGDYRLVVVSNRQPYIHEMIEGKLRYVVPAGGVTTAIDPLMQECGGTWIAYGGGKGDWFAVDEKNKIMVPPDDPAYTLRLVWLTEEEEQGYYYGFSNEALWPLCHNAYTEPVFDARDWETYKAVNQEFANQVLDEIDGHPAAVFTQDYHLALLPRLLRDADPDVITGQFWHIPWPNPEIFRICPWQEELLDGLLGNDVLGFHIGDHCENFLNTVARTVESRADKDYSLVNYRGETTLAVGRRRCWSGSSLPPGRTPLYPGIPGTFPEISPQRATGGEYPWYSQCGLCQVPQSCHPSSARRIDAPFLRRRNHFGNHSRFAQSRR